MSGEPFLSAPSAAALVADLVEAGVVVFAPVMVGRRPEFRRIRTLAEAVLDSPDLPRLPLKTLFLPPTEVLFTWRQQRGDVTLAPAAVSPAPAVVLGARPCDAAALDILDRVMGWDYHDEPWFARRAATTILTIACPAAGPDCFCGRVGLGPRSARGSDLLLTPVEAGFRAECVTEKGKVLRERFKARFTAGTSSALEGGLRQADPKRRAPAARRTRQEAAEAAHGTPSAATVKTAAAGPGPDGSPARPFGFAAIRRWLDSHFEDEAWMPLGLRCHGCGACASVCPACHCFDIVDEADGLLAGARRRNWDTCQSPRFTVHASGHNPRAGQAARFRQRVMHKFAIYPARFDAVLCTGCGRCTAACPAGQHLPEILESIEKTP